MSEKLVPIPFVQALLFPLQHKGIDVLAFLAARNINVQISDGIVVQEITNTLYNSLVVAVLQELQDERGGLVGHSKTPFGTSKMLIYAVLNCDNLQEAMQRAIDFNFACVESPDANITLRLEHNPEQRTASLFYYRAQGPDGKRVKHNIWLTNLAIWLRICSWLIGRQIEIVGAQCAGAKPSDESVLRHFLSCPIVYDEPINSLTFSDTYLRASITRTETELEQFMRNAPYQVIVGDELGKESVASQIRRVLQSASESAPPAFEDLANDLYMSVRTLRRRLDEEGVSYQQLKDDTRRDMACKLLQETDLPIMEVADKVGFSDASAFHRSFRKWTGLAPGEYRKQ